MHILKQKLHILKLRTVILIEKKRPKVKNIFLHSQILLLFYFLSNKTAAKDFYIKKHGEIVIFCCFLIAEKRLNKCLKRLKRLKRLSVFFAKHTFLREKEGENC